VLVDGDVFEPVNALRQEFPVSAVGTNKAEALAGWVREAGLACQAVAIYLDEANVGDVLRQGDIVLLAVDNHRTRALVDCRLGGLREATLISGGNDEIDGNVQLVRRQPRRHPHRDPSRDRHDDRRSGEWRRMRGPGGRASPASRNEPDGRLRDAQLPLGSLRTRQRPVQRGLPRHRPERGSPASPVPRRCGRSLTGAGCHLVRPTGRAKNPADPLQESLVANDQLANPFRPGNGVLPAYLAGREKPLAEFDAFIADSHPLHANWTVTGLGDSLTRLDDALKTAHRPGALLLYDEAHLLADDRSRERYPLSSLLSALGAVQRSGEPRVRIVLTGLPTLSVNLKRARTYAERILRYVVLVNLERGDAWDALTIPLARTQRRFATSVVGEIVEATGGYPHFLQFFGAYVWRAVPAMEVTPASYRAVEPALLHELDLAFFEDRFEAAPATEQRVLEVMAREHGQLRLTTLRPLLDSAVGSLDLVVRRPVERGLIYRATRGTCDFALPLLRPYPRRRAADLSNASPDERVGER